MSYIIYGDEIPIPEPFNLETHEWTACEQAIFTAIHQAYGFKRKDMKIVVEREGFYILSKRLYNDLGEYYRFYAFLQNGHDLPAVLKWLQEQHPHPPYDLQHAIRYVADNLVFATVLDMAVLDFNEVTDEQC